MIAQTAGRLLIWGGEAPCILPETLLRTSFYESTCRAKVRPKAEAEKYILPRSMLGNESSNLESMSRHTRSLDAKNHFSELPGTVHAQYRRRGSKVYGPYWFRFWREGGRLRKEYLAGFRIDEARTLCNARQKRRTERLASQMKLRTQNREGRAIMRELKQFDQVFSLLNILETKDEDQLTDLQWKRVRRVFTEAGIEI